MQLIDRLDPENPRLSEALEALVSEYRFDMLVELTSRALESKQHEQGQE